MDTTWTLPYAVAVDGSEGTVVVVINMAGIDTILTTTRPSPTTVRAVGDWTLYPATIGVSYNMSLTLSKLHLRNLNRAGEEVAETAGRTQVRRIRVRTEDTQHLTVTVTNDGRTSRSYVFTEDTPIDATRSVPVLAKNDTADIVLSNSTPFSTRLVSLDWEAFYETKARRV